MDSMEEERDKRLNSKGKGKKTRKKKRHKGEEANGLEETKFNGEEDDLFIQEGTSKHSDPVTAVSALQTEVDDSKTEELEPQKGVGESNLDEVKASSSEPTIVVGDPKGNTVVTQVDEVESKPEIDNSKTNGEASTKDEVKDVVKPNSAEEVVFQSALDDVIEYFSENKATETPDSGKGDSESSTQEDYKVKVEGVKNRLRSSKSLIDDEAKSTQQKIVRTGFWDKLRFAMSQPIEDEQAVTECRRMFREEMVRLRREVEEFQELCLKQIKVQKQYVDDHRRTCEKEINDLGHRNGMSRRLSIVSEGGGDLKEGLREEMKRLSIVSEEGGDLKEGLREELTEMESSMEFFQEKQKLLDQEMELLNKEEELAKKHKDLEEYEKEIQEVESLLNQRQAICDRRQKHLLVLDEELHSLRQELEESKDQLQTEASSSGVESATSKAKKNCLLSPRLRSQEEWDIVRRNLMDKQHLLENTVQKYRSELASASSNIAGKEILIGKLQQQLAETEGMVITSERRIKQLENKLAFSVTESRILEDQLHGVNRKNSINLSPDEMGRRSSMFHRSTSSEASGSRSGAKSPFLLTQNDLSEESRPANGTSSARPSSLSSDGTTVIRRRSMRSNSVAGETLSRMALREKEQDKTGSGACAVM